MSVLVRPAVAREGAVGRDVFIDAVRAVGTASVILVHWLMPEVAYSDGRLAIGNALGHGGAWVLTWVLEVLPLLFFAAGASAAHQLARRPVSTVQLVTQRLPRLLRPVAAFAATWVVLLGALLALGAPAAVVGQLVRLAPQLLWFLGVYVLLLLLTPNLAHAHARWGWRLLVCVIAAPFAVDLLRFGIGVHGIGIANVVLGWLVPYLLGMAYVDARRRSRLPSARGLVIVAAGALCAAVLLATLGPYPASLIGLPGEPVSNLAPPTALAVAHGVLLTCLVLLARRVLVDRASAGRCAVAVGWVSRHSMTLYLWHLTAMFVVAASALAFDAVPDPWSVTWWLSRPLWFVAAAAVLGVLVHLFARHEHGCRPSVLLRSAPRTRYAGHSARLEESTLPIDGWSAQVGTQHRQRIKDNYGLCHQEAPQADGEEEAPQAAAQDASPASQQEVT